MLERIEEGHRLDQVRGQPLEQQSTLLEGLPDEGEVEHLQIAQTPPWMSLLDRLEVPAAQSRASTIPVTSPRVAASSAVPAPTTPPPTTRMSSSRSAIRASAAPRSA
ncbi:hypothetical protein GCM10020000_46100 [Streptomyces olivoverticillatus]